MANGDLKPEAFAEVIKLCADVKRIGGACLIELRAIRLSLADDGDSSRAKAEGAKAEGATAEAVASSSDPVMGAVEQIMKEQMAKGLGIDPTALTSGNLDQVALAAMIRSKINEPAPAPTT